MGEGLTPEIAAKFAAAFGTYVGAGKVIIGRDPRKSGEMFRHAVLAGLLSVGCEVIDLGICPTPTIQLATESLKAQGGIAITASHNPAHWNGIKFIGPEGIFLTEEQGKELREIYDRDQIPWVRWDGLGTVRPYGTAVENHIQKILDLDFLEVELIQARGFRVVLDCCNGAGGTVGPELLRTLGCELIELNCEPHGQFPHNPEPVPEHLNQLCSTVKLHQADAGFALDPDGDRLAIVSDKGEPLGEDYSLAIAIRLILQKRKGTVVVNLSTSKVIDDIATPYRVPVLRTPVGEVHVALCMKQVGAVIGGEGNGGVILPEIHYGRDAFVGMALALQALTEFGGTMTELAESFPKYHVVKKKWQIEHLNWENLVKFFSQEYPEEEIDLTDGLKVSGKDWWIHLRESNTEPILRIIAEASSEEEAIALCNQTMQRLRQLTMRG